MAALKVVPIGLKTGIEDRMKLALRAMPAAVAWNRLDDGRIEFTNDKYAELFGYSADDFANVFELVKAVFVNKAQADHALETLHGLIGKTVLDNVLVPNEELLMKRKDGSVVLVSFSGIVLPQANMVLVMFVDITASKEREELLHRLASEDPLTGLANRRAFDDVVTRSIVQRSPFGVLLLDIDKFKQLNDAHGHSAGDELLIHFARALKTSFRASDTIARWGGDEFAVLVSSPVSNEKMAEAVERLKSALSDLSAEDAPAEPVSVSAGWAVFPDDGDNAAALFRVADAAMYANKRSRKTPTSDRAFP